MKLKDRIKQTPEAFLLPPEENLFALIARKVRVDNFTTATNYFVKAYDLGGKPVACLPMISRDGNLVTFRQGRKEVVLSTRGKWPQIGKGKGVRLFDPNI